MGRQASILLVDDDLNVRQALGEALAVENYQVALAASGDEAVRRLREKGGTEFDAVLLDLRLGPGNGWQVFDHLTTLHPCLPVIIITAAREQEALIGARQCVAVMEKPLDLPRLFDTLRSVTARREPYSQQRIGSSSLEAQDRSAA